jgi:hypothetical protein
VKTLIALLSSVLADVIRGLISDFRKEQLARRDALAKSAERAKRTMRDARKTVDGRSLDDTRNRLREHARTKGQRP